MNAPRESVVMSEAEIARFMAKVQPEPNTGCWLWDGAVDPYGYGYVSFGGRTHRAHRVSHCTWRGPVVGLVVCHRCDTTACVNPDHLFTGSQSDNLADMARKGRSARGSKNANARITAETAIAMRAECHNGASVRDVALRHGVDRRSASMIVRGRQWSHVGGPRTDTARRAVVKLDAPTVMRLRTRHANGESQRALARELGVNSWTAWAAVRRRTWHDVPDEPDALAAFFAAACGWMGAR